MHLFITKPLLRKTVRADLDLFKMMEETDPGYEKLRNHINSQVRTMIKEEEKKGLIEGKLPQFLFGLLLTGGLGYWIYQIVTGPTSNWWMILTGCITFKGRGFLTGAIMKPSPNKVNATNAKSRVAD
jgi:hypothetical protein